MLPKKLAPGSGLAGGRRAAAYLARRGFGDHHRKPGIDPTLLNKLPAMVFTRDYPRSGRGDPTLPADNDSGPF